MNSENGDGFYEKNDFHICSSDLSVNEEQQFRAGDRVEVRFDGVVQESDPMQIKTVFVELVK